MQGLAEREASFMQLDLPGSITPFVKVTAGSIFGYFAGGFGIGMRVKVQGSDQAAVLTFVAGASLVVINKDRSVNRDVFVFTGAKLRAVDDCREIKDSAKTQAKNGSLIMAENAAFIRANVLDGDEVDIELVTGEGIPVAVRPGAMLIDRWRIVVPRSHGELALFHRGEH
jgi:hypothetical protein